MAARQETGESHSGKIETTSLVSSVAETLSTFAASIARLNSLGEAKDLLKEAKKLDLAGEHDESKQMVEQIFVKLFEMRGNPEGLDSVSIQKIIQDEKSSEDATNKLIDMLSTGQETGKIAKTDPERRKTLKNLEKIGDPEADPSVKDKSEKGLAVEAKQISAAYEKEETSFLKEFEAFIEKSKNAEFSKQLRSEVKEAMKIGVFSKEKLRENVTAIREKLQKHDFKKLAKTEKMSVKDVAEVLRGVRDGTALEKLGKVTQRTKGPQARMLKIARLMKGLNTVVAKVESGASLRDAVVNIDELEFKELQAFLASMQEKKNKDLTTATYYDPQYAELIKELNFGEQEKNGIQLLLEEIQTQKASGDNERLDIPSSQEQVQSGGRKNNSTFQATRDAEGNIIDTGIGMEHSLGRGWDYDTVEALRKKSMGNINNLVEIDANGVVRPIGYQEELRRKEMEHKMAEAEYKRRGLESRESLLNIDMKALFEVMAAYDKIHAKKTGFKLLDMIDKKYREKTGVTKLTDEVMFGQDRSAMNYFESWWRQEAYFEVRRMAYEGVFEKRNQSLRMLKWNSMNEILGVSTAMKAELNWRAAWFGVIDQQNNTLANQEMFMDHAKFFGGQGVDFRLDHSLKVNREEICVEVDGKRSEAVGTISMFDALTFQQLKVGNSDPLDKEIRRIAGMPDSCTDMTYGTLINKYAEGKLRGDVRRAIWNRFATAELGVGLDMKAAWNKLNADQQTMIFERYSNQFEAALNYASTHQMLHTMIGNASFVDGKVELPAAMAEGHLKNDVILYRHLFVHRFDGLGQRLPELYAYYDSGLRDHVTMAPEEYAGMYFGMPGGLEILRLKQERKALKHSHQSTTQIDKEIEEKIKKLAGSKVSRHSTGSPTIYTGLLGKKEGDSITEKDAEHAATLQEVFANALFHWGKEVHRGGHGHHEPFNDLGEWGVTGEYATAFRRRATDIRKELIDAAGTMDSSVFDAINWDEYCKNFGDARLTKKMKSLRNGKDKWLLMANTWGDASFKFDSMATKRVPDHIIKYSQDYAGKYQQDFLAWMASPNKVELEAKLNEQVNAMNSAAVVALQEKRAQALMGYSSEELGVSWLGGGSAEIVSRKKDSRGLNISKDKVGANGLPLWDKEVVYNNGNPLDPMKTNTAFSRLGIGRVGRDEWMRRIQGYYTLNYISEEKFREMYKHLQWEPLHTGKVGALVTAYRWLNFGEPLMEVVAPFLGITAHDLRHIIFESGEKTLNTVSSEIFGVAVTGGGGGGHH